MSRVECGGILWRLAVYLLAAAGLSLTASPARASCGDYVTVGTEHAAPPHAPVKPCDGPNCSHQPDRPLPPPAAAPVPGEHPLCAALLPALAATGPVRTISIPTGACPAGPSSRLERPPRA